MRHAPRNPVFNLYECAGGDWIAVGGLQGDRYWPDFCGILGLPEMGIDLRYATMQQRTTANRKLVALLDAEFSKRTSAHLLGRFAEAGIPRSPVNSYTEPRKTAR